MGENFIRQRRNITLVETETPEDLMREGTLEITLYRPPFEPEAEAGPAPDSVPEPTPGGRRPEPTPRRRRRFVLTPARHFLILSCSGIGGLIYGGLLAWLLRTAQCSSTMMPAPDCLRAPDDAQSQDWRYALRVTGEPDLFLPGELYTVTLQGVDSGKGVPPFRGFTIWVELDDEIDPYTTQSTTEAPTNQSLGAFQAYDAQTKQHEFCFPSVDNATAHPKTEIQVIWNAPLNAADLCLRICARVEPANGKGAWSVLKRKICAAHAAPASFTRQPPIVEPCCACDEAKYEVTFEGLWSRNTHPREFPPESARAHFGEIIGASHTAQYRVWQEGRNASPGLRQLADDGSTTALEKELKAQSDHIRTIIKARGTSWQQVAGSSMQSTFAVFRVDAKNHLMSLVAKLAPSPDWIVGVSALELCNPNCTWRTSATLPLYPYDAGMDSGIGYTSRRQPTIPLSPVRALRPDWPRDVRSPFFSTTGEMRPFARLRLNRLRLYEKSCDISPGVPSPERKTELGSGACMTHSWGAWSPCSVTCGEGRASRQRHYMWPARARSEACRALLTDHRKCRGPRMHCRAITDYEPDPAESSGPCAVSPWSAWSPCDGCGVRARTRHYIGLRAHKRCHIGFRARTILSQALPCAAGPCTKPPPGTNSTMSNYDWFFMDVGTETCKVTAWGDWSPCSSPCGRGRQLRARLYLAHDNRVQQEVTKRLLASWNQRYAEWQNLDVPPVHTTVDDPELEKQIQEQMDRCQFTMSMQEALCDGEETDCLDSITKETCMLPVAVGHCRSYTERWFWDAANGRCEPFGFTGCGGNGNNFPTHEACHKRCNQYINVTASSTTTTAEPNTKKTRTTPSSADNEVLQNDGAVPEDVNCEVGAWLGWTTCLGDCDYALKLNYRLVQTKPSGSGKSCPNLVKSRTCKPGHCRKSTTLAVTEFAGDDIDPIIKAKTYE